MYVYIHLRVTPAASKRETHLSVHLRIHLSVFVTAYYLAYLNHGIEWRLGRRRKVLRSSNLCVCMRTYCYFFSPCCF